MQFLGWQGIVSFVAVVGLIVFTLVFFAKKIK